MSEKYVEKFRSTTTGEVYTVKDPNVDTKQDILVSGTNIKTINNESILGSGNIEIGGSGGTTDYDQLDNRPQINSITLTGNKSLSDLGIAASSDLQNKQDILTSENAGLNITITEESGVVKINATGSGGTSDYSELINKPQINSIELSGDKTSEDLNLISIPETITDLSSTEITISKVNANTNYYYGILASLTIQDNDDSPLASNIFLNTGSTFTFTITDTLKTSGNYNLLPNKSYKLTICDNILTVQEVEIHSKIPVINLLDEPESYTPGYYTTGTTPTISTDFCQKTITVTPNQDLYMDYVLNNLSITYLDENFTKVLQVGTTTDEDGKFTVPSNSNIRYMSIPLKASVASLKTLSTTKIDKTYGNMSKILYKVVTGDASSLQEITSSNTFGFIWNSISATYSASNTWHVNFIRTDEILMCWDGYLLLGLDSNYRALGISRTGELAIFNGTTKIDQTPFEDFDLSGDTFIVASSIEKNITPFKIKFGSTTVQIYNYPANELIQELSYDDINSHLVGGETYSTFNEHSLGCIWKESSENPNGWTQCGFRSTLPVVESLEIIPETNPDLVDTWWRGKEWYAYGTSMTDESMGGYAVKLAAMTGMNIHNYGKGGSGIIPSLHPGDNVKTRCMRTTDGKVAADLITVEVIPNDRAGTLGDPTDTGDETFLGNLNQIIEYLQKNCPKAQIVILTATRPRYYTNEETGITTQYPPESQNVTSWLEWEDGVKEVCRRNCIQYWNGADNCGLGYHRVKTDTSANKYVRDSIHLTDVGAENLAYYFLNQLKNLPLWHPTYDL